MVRSVEIASEGWSPLPPCQTVVYPASRTNASAGKGIGIMLPHSCNSVTDSQMVKVFSCLADRYSECGGAGQWIGGIT